jgi:hypothetical protein
LDDRHDRLRAVEGSLIRLEEQPQTTTGVVLVRDSELMCGVVRDGGPGSAASPAPERGRNTPGNRVSRERSGGIVMSTPLFMVT